MLRIDVEKITLIGIYLIAAGIVFSQVLGYGEIVSGLFYISFVFVFIFWILSLIKYPLRKSDILVGAIIVLSLLSVLLSALLHSVTVTFAYMKKAIIFWCTVLFFQTASKVTVDRNTANAAVNIVVVTSVFLALCFYLMDNSRLYSHNGVTSKYLTFGFTNPNLTAQFLLCFACAVYCKMLDVKSKLLRFALLLLLVQMIVLISLTRSRTALLVVAFFLVYAVFAALRKKEWYSVGKVFPFLVAGLPLFVALAYLLLYHTDNLHLLDFLSSEGKLATSRVYIWSLAMERVMESPFLGAYWYADGGNVLGQMHNTHVDIAVSYGIPVLVLTIIWLFSLIRSAGRRCTKREIVYLIAFSSCLLLGVGEAVLFGGGIGIYLFAGVFLLVKNGFYSYTGEGRMNVTN